MPSSGPTDPADETTRARPPAPSPPASVRPAWASGSSWPPPAEAGRSPRPPATGRAGTPRGRTRRPPPADTGPRFPVDELPTLFGEFLPPVSARPAGPSRPCACPPPTTGPRRCCTTGPCPCSRASCARRSTGDGAALTASLADTFEGTTALRPTGLQAVSSGSPVTVRRPSALEAGVPPAARGAARARPRPAGALRLGAGSRGPVGGRRATDGGGRLRDRRAGPAQRPPRHGAHADQRRLDRGLARPG